MGHKNKEVPHLSLSVSDGSIESNDNFDDSRRQTMDTNDIDHEYKINHHKIKSMESQLQNNKISMLNKRDLWSLDLVPDTPLFNESDSDNLDTAFDDTQDAQNQIKFISQNNLMHKRRSNSFSCFEIDESVIEFHIKPNIKQNKQKNIKINIHINNDRKTKKNKGEKNEKKNNMKTSHSNNSSIDNSQTIIKNKKIKEKHKNKKHKKHKKHCNEKHHKHSKSKKNCSCHKHKNIKSETSPRAHTHSSHSHKKKKDKNHKEHKKEKKEKNKKKEKKEHKKSKQIKFREKSMKRSKTPRYAIPHPPINTLRSPSNSRSYKRSNHRNHGYAESLHTFNFNELI